MNPVWLVLPDPFSSRLFFDTGIVDQLRGRLGDRLELFLLDTSEHEAAWSERAGDERVTRAQDLRATGDPAPVKAFRRADEWLDRQGRASIHSRCARACGKASTAGACSRGTRTGFSTPTSPARCRSGRRSTLR